MKNILVLLTILIILILSSISCSLFPTGTSAPPPPDKPMETFLRDYEYVDRRVFDLALPTDNLQPTDIVTKLIMYESVPSYQAIENPILANLYANPNDTSQFNNEAIAGNVTNVNEIPADEFTYYDDADRNIHYIVFNSQRSRSYHIGYYMEVTAENGSIRQFGSLTDSFFVAIDTSYGLIDTTYNPIYNLKLLAPADNLFRPNDVTWQLMWRNCYEVPKGIAQEYMTINVYKGLEGTEGTDYIFDYQGDDIFYNKFLGILGLDLENNLTGVNMPDSIVDNKPEIYRPDWGLLMFPNRKPFNDTTRYYYNTSHALYGLPELEVKIPELYDYTSWTEKSEASQYFIRFEWLE